MPYRSMAQNRFFHSAGARKKGIKPSTVEEFDQATNFESLPERVARKPKPKTSSRKARTTSSTVGKVKRVGTTRTRSRKR